MALCCLPAYVPAQTLPGPLLPLPQVQAPAVNNGRFEGSLQVEWLPDETHMLVLAPFDFIDPSGLTWSVGRGNIVDGSCLPGLAWTLMREPFDDKYREASVIHDVACHDKEGDWEAADAAFYHALLASGVDKPVARLLYAVVYHLGQRWDTRLELKNIPASRAQIEANRLLQQLPASKDAKLTLIPAKQNAAELAAHQPAKVSVLVTAAAARRTISEVDFVLLRLALEKRETSSLGPMTLEEIRNFQAGK
ncbi:DUF1353 domain-containing protein [Undibacterium terreum]|uniref:DUF1353 domain-containing protein n=1 Tax=Undibacterium terreum TaxID=1224302 RepID=A0A916U839_9BURK|nr:DUF1353 domain-containing protein [Undibacterium terreum]GGC62646.1 hypothetical protein GCM10011396_07010 [Undibacterium terreum]